MDVDRLVIGLATVYGQRNRNDGSVYRREDFDRFLAVETAVPLRLNHGPLISSRGAIKYIGRVFRFASIADPEPGLLILAEVDDADGFGDELLADLARLAGNSYLPDCWGLSLGSHVSEEVGAWPYEVSVVHDPAVEGSRILAVGSDALGLWDLLTRSRQAVT